MTSLMAGPSTPGLHLVYIPAVCLLIFFQGYYSQYLFSHDPELAPGPLTRRQTVSFNVLLAILWWTYYLACTVDPGRYLIPRRPTSSSSSTTCDSSAEFDLDPKTTLNPTRRWCKKCRRPKPLRAHHCRHCGRCIPKMDHHCPWTGNCVSMQTFPYFLRFLLYTNMALLYLARLIWQRAGAIWASRHLPAYLGPSVGSLIGLTVLALVNAGTVLALGILLYTTVKGWVFNCTMIEEWEIERHEAVLARLDEDHRRGSDGYFWGDDDEPLRERLERIEFPYDVGVFANMAQAMGTRNVLRWFLPVFGGGPRINNETPGKGAGWEWEENGFNDLPGLWPPPDPEKMRQAKRGGWPGAMQQPEGRLDEYQTPEEVKAAFARRQQEDFLRRRRVHARQAQQRPGIIAELEEVDELPGTAEGNGSRNYERAGKPLWTNSDGDRLWDYGVDEEVEEEIVPTRVDDDDDVPLAELIRKRRVLTREEDG
ncbi:DHHC palmitoyltransferase-domain-containing protein [Chaetomium strumarium]|uniref:Palmitoyltransferase PFA4 n=1 Tax=Chaetomium strumarium TaxID=1170767 RepID=A0AAJ0H2E4_9PEZI|nr:DHHC palmitoyltransferase-domain-containing protein [Chaetomium strumarium]